MGARLPWKRKRKLNARLPNGLKFVCKSFTVPLGEEAETFSLQSTVPNEAYLVYAVTSNQTEGYKTIATYKGPNGDWRIKTETKSQGNFYIRILYLINS